MKSRFALITIVAAAVCALGSGAEAQVGPSGPRPLVSSPSTTEKFTKIAINGNGPTNFSSLNCAAAGLVCPSSDVCQCIETTGNYKGNVVGSGTFDFLIDADLTRGGLPQGSSGTLYFSAGLITLTNGSNVLVLNTNGIVGNSPLGDGAQYSGSYGVSSGTGKFATTIGSGQATWNNVFATGDTQVSLVGNIDVKP